MSELLKDEVKEVNGKSFHVYIAKIGGRIIADVECKEGEEWHNLIHLEGMDAYDCAMAYWNQIRETK